MDTNISDALETITHKMAEFATEIELLRLEARRVGAPTTAYTQALRANRECRRALYDAGVAHDAHVEKDNAL